jgi:hypothetical protein
MNRDPSAQSDRENARSERTRREALARNLCARICDDHRTIEQLVWLDDVLTAAVRCDADVRVVLERMHFAVDGDCSEPERSYRVGWNHAIDNVTRLLTEGR